MSKAEIMEDFEELNEAQINACLAFAADSIIFDFARAHNFHIVTFDADFIDISLIKGAPPKIIWLRTGNLTTQNIAQLLQQSLPQVQSLMASE